MVSLYLFFFTIKGWTAYWIDFVVSIAVGHDTKMWKILHFKFIYLFHIWSTTSYHCYYSGGILVVALFHFIISVFFVFNNSFSSFSSHLCSTYHNWRWMWRGATQLTFVKKKILNTHGLLNTYYQEHKTKWQVWQAIKKETTVRKNG